MVCAVKNKHVWNNTEMDGILGCTNSVVISVCSGNKADESVLVFIQHCVSYCSMPAGKEKPTHGTPDVPKYTFRINSQDRLMYWFFFFSFKMRLWGMPVWCSAQPDWKKNDCTHCPHHQLAVWRSLNCCLILSALCSCSSQGHPFLILLTGFLNNAI